jgi:hypothetical protein
MFERSIRSFIVMAKCIAPNAFTDCSSLIGLQHQPRSETVSFGSECGVPGLSQIPGIITFSGWSSSGSSFTVPANDSYRCIDCTNEEDLAKDSVELVKRKLEWRIREWPAYTGTPWKLWIDDRTHISGSIAKQRICQAKHR